MFSIRKAEWRFLTLLVRPSPPNTRKGEHTRAAPCTRTDAVAQQFTLGSQPLPAQWSLLQLPLEVSVLSCFVFSDDKFWF
jgi:hypothetical protein